jgi:hypothetical protein
MKATLAALLLLTSFAMAETKWTFDAYDSKVEGKNSEGKIVFYLDKPHTIASVQVLSNIEYTAQMYDVTVEVGAWKAPQKWRGPARAMSIEGTELLSKMLTGGQGIRLRYFPPGKQSIVADFDRGDLDIWLPAIKAKLAELNKRSAPKPAPIGVR